MVLIGVLLFALLIIVHELGHFWAARKSGVEVEEFGIGFPPRIFGRRFGKSKTLYSFNLIPLGGFVKLKGEADDDRTPGGFGAASYTQKLKILLAGVGMNVVAAFGLLLILAWVGLPNLIANQFSVPADERDKKIKVLVADVLESSVAESVGIKPGANIIKVDGMSVRDADTLSSYTQSKPDQSVQLTFEQEGSVNTTTVMLRQTPEGKGQLGVVPFDAQNVRYTWSAPVVAAGITLQLGWLTLKGLGGLVWGLITQGSASPALATAIGPVGLFALLDNVGNLGFSYVILLIINISLSLAIINALPLPALDGGRLALITVFRLIKKPLPKKVETAIHSLGFIILLGLVILISYFDVKRFF